MSIRVCVLLLLVSLLALSVVDARRLIKRRAGPSGATAGAVVLHGKYTVGAFIGKGLSGIAFHGTEKPTLPTKPAHQWIIKQVHNIPQWEGEKAAFARLDKIDPSFKVVKLKSAFKEPCLTKDAAGNIVQAKPSPKPTECGFLVMEDAGKSGLQCFQHEWKDELSSMAPGAFHAVVAAVHAMHKKKVAHGDLHMDNVGFGPTCSITSLKLIDVADSTVDDAWRMHMDWARLKADVPTFPKAAELRALIEGLTRLSGGVHVEEHMKPKDPATVAYINALLTAEKNVLAEITKLMA